MSITLLIVLGLGSGALYAALAVGVVANYRGCDVVNIGLGGVALLGAYVYFGLRAGYLFLPPIPFIPDRIEFGGPVPVVPAVLIAVGVCTFTGILFDWIVLRPMRTAAPLAKLMATLGLLLAIQSVVLLHFGASGQLASSVLPDSADDVVHLFGTPVPLSRLLIVAIVILIAVGLGLVYKWTRFGLATRAAAENDTNAMLYGLPPNQLSLVNTAVACSVAGAVGVLAAPMTQLNTTTIPMAIVPALGAALLARFSSFGIATIAGFGMGLIGSLVTYLQAQAWFPTAGGLPLPGLTDLVYFLIIVAAMYWRGSSLPGRGTLTERRLPQAPRPDRVARPAMVCALICVTAALLLPFDYRQALINTLIGIVVCLSYVVITGFVGQISLIQVTLGGVAAFATAKLSMELGIGFPLGPILGIILATVIGVLVAMSALRVRGVQLAVVTLAAAVAVANFGFDNTVWGGGYSGIPVDSPLIFGVNLGPSGSFPLGDGKLPSPVFAFVCAAAAILTGLLVANLRRSGLGQRMLAVRSNEAASAAAGIPVTATKVAAFAISSAIAALAGILYAYNFEIVTADRFGVISALMFISFAYVGGISSVTGAVVAGLGVTQGLIGVAMTNLLGVPQSYQLLVAGLLLMLTLAHLPAGLAGGRKPPLPIKFVSRLIVGPPKAPTPVPVLHPVDLAVTTSGQQR